jgi:hypothetical protein
MPWAPKTVVADVDVACTDFLVQHVIVMTMLSLCEPFTRSANSKNTGFTIDFFDD